MESARPAPPLIRRIRSFDLEKYIHAPLCFALPSRARAHRSPSVSRSRSSGSRTDQATWRDTGDRSYWSTVGLRRQRWLVPDESKRRRTVSVKTSRLLRRRGQQESAVVSGYVRSMYGHVVELEEVGCAEWSKDAHGRRELNRERSSGELERPLFSEYCQWSLS